VTSIKVIRAAVLAIVLLFMASFVLGHAGVWARPAEAAEQPTTTVRAGHLVPPRLGKVEFAPDFPAGVQLVTNDYAYFNKDDPRAVRSGDWIVTSGSLLARNGRGWTGVPDSVKPNADSTNGTGSAIFRMVTRRRSFDNVAVSFDLLNQRFVTTTKTPAHSWDGVHVFLHYQSQHSLYALAINRRDGTLLVKKKRPGGTANGGTYYPLGDGVSYEPPLGRWQHVLATITSNTDGTVTIAAYLNGQLVLIRTDTGTGGRPLTGPGAIGIRGDNAEFEFAHFRVLNIK
jgi:hypothetical protein